MSTEEDGRTLTRKQLRELRLTGSTPVIGGDDAAEAPAEPTPAQQPVEPPSGPSSPEETPAPEAGSAATAESSDAPLTRRAARAQERVRTGSVPVPTDDDEPVVHEPVVQEPVVEEPVVQEPVIQEPVIQERVVEEHVVEAPELVSGIPAFAPQSTETPQFDVPGASAAQVDEASADETSADEPQSTAAKPTPAAGADESERPKVGAAFGIGVKRSPSSHGTPAAFDDLLETGSAGAHKTSSTLIFTPSPGAGSLSGPVASTGELLITGTYSLPDGMGSQGHALGAADGKDIDAVLIDGELAPASSPTPIAASSAISTSKPAGEVIRPPVPDKGSKLTLTLAIVAGGLALALAAALIIAFTTGVLG
ncbi:hypothetical protein V2S04_11845 [Microbacterium sp. OR21]|uniref:hypothetical protein n=1 Tax=Microbacterium sp. OR21 TaxID=3095346 RepID=UPI0039B4025A